MLNNRPVMTGRLLEKSSAMQNAAAFGVERAEKNFPDAREADGRRAQGAGLQRHIKIVLGNALRSRFATDFPNDENFGMGGGVFQLNCAVAVGRSNFSAGGVHQHRADRHFVPCRRLAGFFQSQGHCFTVDVHGAREA